MNFNDQEYGQARRDHALWLRANGEVLRGIGRHLGVSGDRARKLLINPCYGKQENLPAPKKNVLVPAPLWFWA